MSAPATPSGGAAPPAFGPWSDPSGRRRFAQWALAAALFLLVVDVLWSLLGMAAVGGLYEPPAEVWFDHFDTVWTGISVAYMAAFTVAAVAFVRWHCLALRNTAFLGDERPLAAPAVTVLQWLVPVVSLVLPWIGLRSIAEWSRPPGRPSANALLGWWWGLWVASGVLVGATGVLQRFSEGTGAWIVGTAAEAASTLVLVASGVLAARVVRLVSSWQLDKASALAAQGGGGPGRPLVPSAGALDHHRV